MEKLKIKDLICDPSNARSHSQKNLDAIKGSLAKFGQQKPIVISKDNVVLAGNGTLLSAKDLGWTEIGVIRSALAGAEAVAYAVADNRSGELASWDDDVLSRTLAALKEDNFDLDAIGFDAKDLEQWLKSPTEVPPGCDEDEVPERVEPKARLGDLYLLGDHRILCGDSTDPNHVERLLAGSNPVLMVTDPPYGVEYDPAWRNVAAKKGLIGQRGASRQIGKVRNDDRVDWSSAYVLYGADVAYVWHAGKFSAEVQKSLEDADFVIISQIVWAKANFAISRGDYHWQHEPCWYAHKKGKNHNWQGSRSESTLWKIENGCKEKTGHSTEKPVECMERPIRNNTKQGDVVCDPFSGSGSTLIACEKTGRKCFGMEIEPHYCDIIVARWEKYTGKTATLAEK